MGQIGHTPTEVKYFVRMSICFSLLKNHNFYTGVCFVFNAVFWFEIFVKERKHNLFR